MKKITKQLFDGFVGIVLVLYALGLFVQVVLMEMVNPAYILSYNAWFEIVLALLIVYVSKEKIEKIKW